MEIVKYYAGVGSRDTPAEVLGWMREIASELDRIGFRLRSGGARGADQAFEEGTTEADIYLPWDGFEQRYEGIQGGIRYINVELFANHPQAEGLAEQYHPAWVRCSIGARKKLTRNSYQVLGDTLSNPAEFLVCWTPGGTGSGGTGQALRLAQAYGVPCYDLGTDDGISGMERLIYQLSPPPLLHVRRVLGNILEAQVDAVVNPVNCVGVMGVGRTDNPSLAYQFREAYPRMFTEYQDVCLREELVPGRIHIYEVPPPAPFRFILNFPSKYHWRANSRMDYIESGLRTLVETVRRLQIHSVAIPPLGCGNGGLDWLEVRARIEGAFADLTDVRVLLYEPA